ncbi:MAG TPA: hypothetical protein VGJ14_13690 [Sporichthyaceae bacterium]|jgi:hypothetical protein
MTVTEYPPPSFAHLVRLTDGGGLHEHAEWTRPRAEHGYCLDDVARALLVVSRETEHGAVIAMLHRHYLRFVLAAQGPDGRFRNRKSTDGTWSGELCVEDCWGRAVWGLGAAVVAATAAPGRSALGQREIALNAFERAARWRSPWPRAMSFAGLGAAELLTVHPDHSGARALLSDVVISLRRPASDPRWPWPEPRLTYANAVLPEVLIAAGHALGNEIALADGLFLLRWLLERETRNGHLSVTPVGGSGPADSLSPRFDQQPIEVAALADACDRAFAVTADPYWAEGLHRAARWFLGDNDSSAVLVDLASGGGRDGLVATGRNENQGAESTIALISVLQKVRALSLCAT